MFTTNNKNRLDPALLRPGRMDMHIYFPHCTFSAFKTLANNYLGVKEHKLFPHVEEAFQAGGYMTPAEVGEILLVNKNSPSRALKTLMSALQSGSRRGGNVVVPERPLEIIKWDSLRKQKKCQELVSDMTVPENDYALLEGSIDSTCNSS